MMSFIFQIRLLIVRLSNLSPTDRYGLPIITVNFYFLSNNGLIYSLLLRLWGVMAKEGEFK